MKNLLPLVCFLCMSLSSAAATDITTATVSGHWTLTGSPYKVFNNISVASGQTLTIDPGVDIIFQGPFSINVPIGSHIIAIGTPSLDIDFLIKDTVGWYDKATPAGGWKGITFEGSQFMSGSIDSPLVYCNFSRIKMGKVLVLYRNIKFKNCNFYDSHTNGSAYGSALLSIYSDSTKHTELQQCHFYNNSLDNSCRVVFINGKQNVLINECTFNNNDATPALYSVWANLLITNSSFYDNRHTNDLATTGTITIFESKAVLKGNKIYQNTNISCGAVVCYRSIADINGNVICNNKSTKGYTGGSACGSAQGGGGIRISDDDIALHGYSTIRDNVIANNYAALSGGAAYVFLANVRIYNNTIINNASGDGNGPDCAGLAISSTESVTNPNNVRIKNNIFYENIGTAGAYSNYNVRASCSDTIEYSHNWTKNAFNKDVLVAVGVGGSAALFFDTINNIVGIDPGLINPTTSCGVYQAAINKNFALLASSLCIDKGDTAKTLTDAFDNTNHARVYGSAIDIGAHEYGPWTATLGNAGPIKPSNTSTPFNIYPNPATTMVFIGTHSAGGTIVLQNAAGSLIAERAVTNTLTSIDIHTMPRGIYFATWEHDGVRDTQKVIAE